MSSYTLVLTVPGQSQRRLTVTQARATVGREVGDVVVGDKECSSRHAELLWDGRTLRYKDLDSTNGSFVRGKRVTELELTPGLEVQIGESKLALEADDDVGLAHTMASSKPDQRRQPTLVYSKEAPAVKKAPRRSNTALWVAVAVTGLAAVAVLGIIGVRLLKKADVSLPSVSMNLGGGAVSEGGEATVKAVWFRGQPGVKVEGGTSDINVRVSPNSKDGASVGVIEEFAGGTGNQWRTATWLAAFNASRAAGLSMIQHEYLVRAGGHIDGPSAGMLMTSTMLALLRGKKLLPGTTMTGTINPDGSAGPVGGIVQKMQGAKADGVTRFGYPMGARNHVDLSDNSQVDLNEIGAGLGLEVKEIHDINEAYEFMTGDRLPRVEPLAESELELDADTTARLRAKLTAWKAKLGGEVTQLKSALKKQPVIGQIFAPQIKEIDDIIATANRYEAGDLPVAALQQYIVAALSCVLLRDGITFLDSYFKRDFESINAQIDEARSVAGQVKAYGDELLVRTRRQTVGGQVNTTLALQVYVMAANFSRLAETKKARADEVLAQILAGKLAANQQAIDFVMQNLLLPIVNYHSAKVLLEFSRDYQDLLGEEGQSSNANLGELGREAGGYGSAAGAALAYFDALVTEQIESAQGVTKAQAQSAVAEKEMSYLLARQGVSLTESLKSGEAEGAKNLLRLAAGASAYFSAASLVNKYYALDARERDGVLHITNRKSLTAQLEQARRNAREAAAKAKQQAGFVPAAARLNYQLATAHREGDDATKLEALENYWESAFWAHLATQLSQ